MTTTYTVTRRDSALAPVHGYSLAQAAELVQIDESDILYAIEAEGFGSTDEYIVTEDPASANSDQVMQDPGEYAAFLVTWCGSKAAANAEFVAAIKNDPTFKLAPASWVAAVIRALGE